ncbi:MAG TPA: transglycosylase domain-containing protein, partial [Thermoanaerobaculia bacterium]|nr:transglycosylase domain-containing protein [Thermoanaerobaculia bacterium]
MSFARCVISCLLLGLAAAARADEPSANSLEQDFGRSEVRVFASPFELPRGATLAQARVLERLARLGYHTAQGHSPQSPGEFAQSQGELWIFRRTHWRDGAWQPAARVGVRLGAKGRILGPATAPGEPAREEMPYLEGELLAESLSGDRAPRLPIHLADLPERVWRPLLAIEDSRFFDHPGVDYRAIARAVLANLLRGGVVQGGSTLTQQLVKMRDLTPKRTLGRKVSEAVRAVVLEAEHDKKEILESYLNHVYYGHVGGLAVHGIGAAARAYFSKEARTLSLAEAALLAGIIQSPNRLAPDRHPAEALARRNVVLERLAKLSWASAGEVAAARQSPLGLKLSPPEAGGGQAFLGWLNEIAQREVGGRLEKGRGVVMETTLDPLAQQALEAAAATQLDHLRKAYRRLGRQPLSAAAVILEAGSGRVLAYLGGDPRQSRGGFDRARSAHRQPGSTVKPLVLLEAFERCGERGPVFPSTRVLDRALELRLPDSGQVWKPANNDGRFRGTVTLRQALEASLNVPFVRLARWCGFSATAERLREAGLTLPEPVPPAFSLGAVETTPLELAQAYTVFGRLGRVSEPRPLTRISNSEGWALARFKAKDHRVASAATAWLVRDLMRDAVEEGSGRAAAIPGVVIAGKTGTSSERRDAWFAGT